jgi:hypothetical protein
MARASTESFMVTPHSSEIVCSKVMSFIALKTFWCVAPRVATDMFLFPLISA